ncbi:phosphotransferase [Crossiella cryophila]|uniref:Ser/Thr protein kinase RdoA (MazF antagonist) n=1 Tax=Crossiella cryophila TaxID=43355 RepID=A0A7W7FQ72_9PSEU|nr:phosphotransferase [Crossiella cryophila]MBB4674616.1 Ser/Thr protein kinase RdoA (MazF antagonist) [Crossiella cryophila]
MHPEETAAIEIALGGRVLATRTLAGGFSHQTCLLTLTTGQVVARFGGPDPVIEAAVMAAARPHVPVPQVLLVRPGTAVTRPVMVIEYRTGALLSHVLADDSLTPAELGALGAEVGRVAAAISAVEFDRPGFFTDEQLTVGPERPWSAQLPELVASWLADTPDTRLDAAAQAAWLELCTAHAPALTAVDGQSRLVHSDLNPKNILVSRVGADWRVDAVLDWEFSYAGCPYGDAANMARFGTEYPTGFLPAFHTAFAAHQPATPPANWAYLGRVLDMFALTELVTRPAPHPIADQAATRIRHLIEHTFELSTDLSTAGDNSAAPADDTP